MKKAASHGEEVLAYYAGSDLRVANEARPAGFIGPQGAYHRDMLELFVVTRGGEETKVSGQPYEVGAGEYGLIPACRSHSSSNLERSTCEMNMLLPVDRLDALADQIGIKLWRDWPLGPQALDPPMRRIVENIREEIGGDPLGRDLMLSALATQLMVHLLRRHFGSGRQRDQLGVDAATRLRRVEEMLRADPTARPTLDALAATAGMSRFHFLRAFKKTYGAPPHTYLIHLRVERAAEMIRNSSQSLTTIAHACGFSSSSRLTESFRRRYGTTPSSWRKQSRIKRHNDRNFRKAE